jgi:hypothetical protein
MNEAVILVNVGILSGDIIVILEARFQANKINWK